MTSPSKVEASFRPTYLERVRAEWSVLATMKAVMLFNALFPLAGLFLLWLAWVRPASTPAWSYLAALAALAFVPCMFFYNTLRGHKLALEHGPYTYGFDFDGIHITTLLAQATHLWPAILRVQQQQGNLLFYYSRRSAYFVPVRALPSPESIRKIQAFARAGGVPRVGA